MSFTQSRGLHTIERWQTPAVTILEGLKMKQPIPRGAFKALERFFSLVLAGIEWETKRIMPHGGDAKASCALSIAMKTFRYDNPVDLKKPMEADRRIMQRMDAGLRYIGTKQQQEALRRHLSAIAGTQDPDFQGRFDAAKKAWTKKLQPLVDAARASRRITEKDLQIIINV